MVLEIFYVFSRTVRTWNLISDLHSTCRETRLFLNPATSETGNSIQYLHLTISFLKMKNSNKRMQFFNSKLSIAVSLTSI